MAYTTALILSFLSFAPFGFAGLPDGTLQLRDAFPGAPGMWLRDYDVVHTEVDGDEDVIYLERRAPPPPPPPGTSNNDDDDECTDCDTYSPYTFTAEEEAELTELGEMPAWRNIDFGTALQERSLRKRDEKSKVGACKTTYLGSDIGGFTLKTYPFPENSDFEDDQGGPGKKGSPLVFDFWPWNRPDKKGHWNLQLDTKFQNRPPVMVTKKPSGGGTPTQSLVKNRAVSVEHVLEWNTLLQFIDCKESAARCLHFAKWFDEEIPIDTDLTVQKWKNDGSNDGPPVKRQIKGEREKAIDWVVHQYPGNPATPQTKRIASFYEHEFVSLHDDVNTKKMTVWDGKAVVSEADMKRNIANDYKRQSTANKWKAGNTNRNEGLADAARKLRDVLAVYEYHNHPLIQKIMKAQADRIGAALEYAERKLETTGKKPPNTQNDVPVERMFTDNTDPQKPKQITEKFKRMNEGPLKEQWEDFLEDKWLKAKDTLEDFMDEWMLKLDTAKTKRSLLGDRGVGETFSTMCGKATAAELKSIEFKFLSTPTPPRPTPLMAPTLRKKSKQTLLSTVVRSAAPPAVALDSQSTQSAHGSQSFECELRELTAASFSSTTSTPRISTSATPLNKTTSSAGPSNAPTPICTPTPLARVPSSSIGATASSAAPKGSDDEPEARFADNFDRIEWSQLRAFTKPLRT
ncbi:hypothetical protein CC80DRAFT_556496 [Byssothecium circinans]|uniref:Uncharacterized protein n=1 Tax=Byssothecium circinans TaxID=147558 RepID=A0A6A5TBW4_9PLEO|nr:hypothetical protein CC80DRAFT_556496 [Byssothecium circinans]